MSSADLSDIHDEGNLIPVQFLCETRTCVALTVGRDDESREDASNHKPVPVNVIKQWKWGTYSMRIVENLMCDVLGGVIPSPNPPHNVIAQAAFT